MKPIVLLPPVLALLGGSCWLLAQQRSLNALETESGTLRQAIAAAHQVGTGGADQSLASLSREKDGGQFDVSGSPGKLDWKKVLTALKKVGQRGGPDDFRLNMEMQKRLMQLDTKDLLAQLDSIAAMDATAEEKQQMEGLILGALSQKDPEAAVRRFAGNLAKDRMVWQVNDAFSKWAAKDPSGAMKWFDEAIAAGNFESKSLDDRSGPRTQFEASLLARLVDDNPAAAKERLLKLSADQQQETLSNAFFRTKFESGKEMANLARSVLNQPEALAVLGRGAAQAARQGGLDQATKYFELIGATDAEKAGMAGDVFRSAVNLNYASKLDLAKLDQARTWAQKQVPGQVAKLTGDMLAQGLSQDGSFAEISAQALKYQQQGGDDAVLAEFLASASSQGRTKEALALADKIQDPQKREETKTLLQNRMPREQSESGN